MRVVSLREDGRAVAEVGAIRDCVFLPLDDEVRRALGVFAVVHLVAAVHAPHEGTPAVGIPGGVELLGDRGTNLLVLFARLHDAVGLPAAQGDPDLGLPSIAVGLGGAPVDPGVDGVGLGLRPETGEAMGQPLLELTAEPLVDLAISLGPDVPAQPAEPLPWR